MLYGHPFGLCALLCLKEEGNANSVVVNNLRKLHLTGITSADARDLVQTAITNKNIRTHSPALFTAGVTTSAIGNY